MKPYLKDKQIELVRSLGTQGYSHADLAAIFGTSRQSIQRIVASTPAGYMSPWVKRDK